MYTQESLNILIQHTYFLIPDIVDAMETIVEMDQKIKIESVDSHCLAEVKVETFVKVENDPDVCVPKLETYESALLEDPLNVSNDAQGLLCKSEIKSETNDVDEYYSETPIKTEQDSLETIPVGIIHGADKPFQCPKCSIRFKHKTSLETHVACVHEGKKFIPEVVLESKSKDPFNVSTEDEKLYQCQNCDNKYKHKRSLKVHIGTVHEGKKFGCGQCNKDFSQKCHLNHHIDTVHDGKKTVFQCDQCHKQYSQKCHLN